jgi:hypothetical protein
LPQGRALSLSHLDQIQKRLVESRPRCGLRGVILLLVTFRLDDVDNAFDAEQAIDARRDRIDLAGQYPRYFYDRRQNLFVDTDHGYRVGAPDTQIGVHRSTR